jgi:hypothetical protein
LGNIEVRHLVKQNKIRFATAKMADKPNVAREVVQMVRPKAARTLLGRKNGFAVYHE